jgi:hypothetical protein
MALTKTPGAERLRQPGMSKGTVSILLMPAKFVLLTLLGYCLLAVQ